MKEPVGERRGGEEVMGEIRTRACRPLWPMARSLDFTLGNGVPLRILSRGVTGAA